MYSYFIRYMYSITPIPITAAPTELHEQKKLLSGLSSFDFTFAKYSIVYGALRGGGGRVNKNEWLRSIKKTMVRI